MAKRFPNAGSRVFGRPRCGVGKVDLDGPGG